MTKKTATQREKKASLTNTTGGKDGQKDSVANGSRDNNKDSLGDHQVNVTRGRATNKHSVENWLLSFKNRSESCRKRVASAPPLESKKTKAS